MPRLLLLLLLAAAAGALDFSKRADDDRICGRSTSCSKNYNYSEACAKAIRDQITRELQACLTYLAAGAHFSMDEVARPGIANIFWEHSKEERGHAFKLADYLNLRGDNNTEYLSASTYKPHKDKWSSGLKALQDALRLEKEVTRHFTNMIGTCEKDWHAADWLTSEMLEEQHRGVRDFTGHITRLDKMVLHQPNLAEYIFDQELQQAQQH